MSLLENGAFMDHLKQSKVEAKQQVNSMIDTIYAKLLLDLELWLNKHESKKRNDSSVQQFGVNHDVNRNVNSPLSLPPSHLQSHSNHFTVKSEIDNEKNVTEHNLPGKSPEWQPTPPEPLKSTHLITPHSSSLSIVKEEISSDDEDYNFDCEVEVSSRVIQNEQSPNDPAYLQVHNEFCQETIPNMTYTGFPESDGHKVSNRLSPNTQQPREYNHERMHFDDDLEIDQETLDEVKREIEEVQEMKQRENELEAGDTSSDDGSDRMESDQSEAIGTQASIENSDNGQHNSDESLVIQQNQNDATNTIEDQIANESTTNQIQPNLVQPNRRFQCPHCPKSLVSRSILERHVLVHAGERPFACGQCGKRFSQKGNLNQHQLIHQNIKPFQCDQCDKQFVLKCQLDSHLRTHSGERLFKCNFCELTFIELGTRRTHEKAIYLHVKPYRCKECGHSATQQSNTFECSISVCLQQSKNNENTTSSITEIREICLRKCNIVNCT